MLKTFSAVSLLLAATLLAQSKPSQVSFDPAAKVFRMDGGSASYVFGVNPRGELQQLYWGGRLGATDAFAQAAPMPEWASFDNSYTNTPQEYAGWGAGLYNEPALKVTFADGNRDLVLHYVSHTVRADGFDVLLKDIKRKITVTLHYSMDAESGILARSATIQNSEAQPVTLEQVAAAAWALPQGHYTLELPDRPLGRRMESDARDSASRRSGDREPARLDRPPGQSVVCAAGRRIERESRRSLVRRAGLERLLAHDRRTGPVGRSAGDRRLQSLRLRLRAAPRPNAGDAGLLWRLCERTGWAALRGCCTAMRLPMCCRGRPRQLRWLRPSRAR